MTCKDCQHFSNYLGGSCLLADISKADGDDNICLRFRLKDDKEPEYTPKLEEEYSRYDKDFDHYPF